MDVSQIVVNFSQILGDFFPRQAVTNSILIVPIRDLEAPVRHVFFFLFEGVVWRGVWNNHRVLKNELKNPVDFFLCASTNLQYGANTLLDFFFGVDMQPDL